MDKQTSTHKRQKAIEELLISEAVSDQNRLVELLLTRYNIETNQAVVSRDLRKLGVVKKQVNNSLIYEMPTADVNIEILKLAVLNVTHNEVMILVTTRPGLAAFVGDYLDKCTDIEIAGCIAGENMIFVMPQSIKNITRTFRSLCRAISFKIEEKKKGKIS